MVAAAGLCIVGATPNWPLPMCGPMQAELLKGDWVSSLTGLLYVNDPAVLPPAVVSVHRLAASHDPLARYGCAGCLLHLGLHGCCCLAPCAGPQSAPHACPCPASCSPSPRCAATRSSRAHEGNSPSCLMPASTHIHSAHAEAQGNPSPGVQAGGAEGGGSAWPGQAAEGGPSRSGAQAPAKDAEQRSRSRGPPVRAPGGPGCGRERRSGCRAGCCPCERHACREGGCHGRPKVTCRVGG